jgi:hypothetical protein
MKQRPKGAHMGSASDIVSGESFSSMGKAGGVLLVNGEVENKCVGVMCGNKRKLYWTDHR